MHKFEEKIKERPRIQEVVGRGKISDSLSRVFSFHSILIPSHKQLGLT